MVEYSTVVTIIYFSLNSAFLLSLALWVYRSGSHSSFKSSDFLKDLWNHRRIFGPALVHFSDTATDIGVLWYWAELMALESNTERNIKSMNMAQFFWWSVCFIVLYRVVVLLLITFNNTMVPSQGQHPWLDSILILLDLYILKSIAVSYQGSEHAIKENKFCKGPQTVYICRYS